MEIVFYPPKQTNELMSNFDQWLSKSEGHGEKVQERTKYYETWVKNY